MLAFDVAWAPPALMVSVFGASWSKVGAVKRSPGSSAGCSADAFWGQMSSDPVTSNSGLGCDGFPWGFTKWSTKALSRVVTPMSTRPFGAAFRSPPG